MTQCHWGSTGAGRTTLSKSLTPHRIPNYWTWQVEQVLYIDADLHLIYFCVSVFTIRNVFCCWVGSMVLTAKGSHLHKISRTIHDLDQNEIK